MRNLLHKTKREIVLETLKRIVRFNWRIKRFWLFVGLVIFVGYGVSAISVSAESPRAELTQPVVVVTPTPVTPEQEQIKAYIKQVFGDQATNAFKVLACENHGLRPDARGMNTNGTSDVGIFQINSVHGVPETYLKDWRTNVDIAYHIYKDSGWNAWACVTVYHALERNDTI